MALLLYIASFLLATIAVSHSYLGERYILIRLFRRGDIPKLFGSAEFTIRTLRFAWHITSIAWLGFAGVFLLFAHPPVSGRALGMILSATLLATAAAILLGSRGRHLAWIVFLVTGLIALRAAGVYSG